MQGHAKDHAETTTKENFANWKCSFYFSRRTMSFSKERALLPEEKREGSQSVKR